jgi:hypothetical protein
VKLAVKINQDDSALSALPRHRLVTILLPAPALSVELFRYRGAAKDGGTLEYVFEAGEQNSSDAVTKEKAAEIAADSMTTFYHVQVWSTGNAGISNNTLSVLADLLLRHDQRCTPAIDGRKPASLARFRIAAQAL